MGGVTESEWHFVHLNRLETELSKEAVMMAPQFSRPLQTALDNTRGPISGRKLVFEARSRAPLPQNIAGYVTIPRLVHQAPVFNTDYLVPDVEALCIEDRSIWVQAKSVFAKANKVLRQLNHAESFSVWDYEGKYESRTWSDHVTRSILRF